MSKDGDPPLTELLHRSVSGDDQARDMAWRRLHDELRQIARSRLLKEQSAEIQATELVHEAYLKLVNIKLKPEHQGHFLALASVAMRQVLVDQARARNSQKRGVGLAPLTLATHQADPNSQNAFDLLDIHNAIERLERVDPRKGEALVMSYFGGMTDVEIANALGMSSATAKRDLRMARAWLASELSDGFSRNG